jgi:hypothetical protein
MKKLEYVVSIVAAFLMMALAWLLLIGFAS